MGLLIITILFICSLLCAILNWMNDENIFIGIFLTFLTIFFGIGIYEMYTSEIEDKYNIKTELPEEIYLTKPGDTLYITKRTKDSIYLGFKPIKQK